MWMESDTAGEQRLGSARRQKSSLTALCVPHAVVIAIIVIYNNIKQRCPEQPIANIAPHPLFPTQTARFPAVAPAVPSEIPSLKEKNSPLVITRNKNQLGISAFFFRHRRRLYPHKGYTTKFTSSWQCVNVSGNKAASLCSFCLGTRNCLSFILTLLTALFFFRLYKLILICFSIVCVMGSI